MDLDVFTHRPEREATCRACQWTWLEEDGLPDHTCRTTATTPRDAIAEQARADDKMLTDRELAIRDLRLAEIRRGYAG